MSEILTFVHVFVLYTYIYIYIAMKYKSIKDKTITTSSI